MMINDMLMHASEKKSASEMAFLYQKYNAFQTEKGIDLINKLQLKAGDSILDIGCGTGELTYELAKKVSSTGKIFALEPDTARLKVAIDNQPPDLDNISWYPSTIELFDELPENSIDVVYSNYVLHWVFDKKKALSQINKLLKPDSQFIMNCIAGYSKIICEIETLSGLTDEAFQEKYPLLQKQAWLALLADYHFTDIETYPIKDFEFTCLDEFLLFWEVTTQGKYKRDNLSENNYYDLIKKYPAKIQVFGNETISVLCRSEKRPYL